MKPKWTSTSEQAAAQARDWIDGEYELVRVPFSKVRYWDFDRTDEYHEDEDDTTFGLEYEMRRGTPLPPASASVGRDGMYSINDGNHRMTAAKRLDLKTVPLVVGRLYEHGSTCFFGEGATCTCKDRENPRPTSIVDSWWARPNPRDVLQDEKCFACDKPFRVKPSTTNADTRDGQLVFVGPECLRKIVAAGKKGYQPPLGGPRLWPRR